MLGEDLDALARLPTSLNAKSRNLLYSVTLITAPLYGIFCSVEETRKMEKVKYRALKYVYNDFNSAYCELREGSQMPLLLYNIKMLF